MNSPFICNTCERWRGHCKCNPPAQPRGSDPMFVGFAPPEPLTREDLRRTLDERAIDMLTKCPVAGEHQWTFTDYSTTSEGPYYITSTKREAGLACCACGARARVETQHFTA